MLKRQRKSPKEKKSPSRARALLAKGERRSEGWRNLAERGRKRRWEIDRSAGRIRGPLAWYTGDTSACVCLARVDESFSLLFVPVLANCRPDLAGSTRVHTKHTLPRSRRQERSASGSAARGGYNRQVSTTRTQIRRDVMKQPTNATKLHPKERVLGVTGDINTAGETNVTTRAWMSPKLGLEVS
ncbi:hypothetical protein MPH_08772 [Macrophomina phaseolina MS6]|uniref:Uncharacterized protein n=1 Tax=Macrophomina phaseolina (strain MS6) TaxID=1126212 RepID=K2SAY1_MACPH|nr:hypothetical protein MPH_08772 [Macrophomina phaseolina MS6]